MTLTEYLQLWGSKPFAWGSNDCVLFATRWYRECTGKDALQGIEPWADKAGAVERLKSLGGLESAALAAFGEPRTGWKSGDIVLAHKGYNCLGIIVGSGIVALSDSGIVPLDIENAKFIWNVHA